MQPIPNTNYVRMAPNSAIRNAQAFILLKFITNQHCSKGNYFVQVSKFYWDARKFLPDFAFFNGNPKVYANWEMAAKSVAPLFQTIPRNIHPDLKPSICRQKAYTNVLSSSNIDYCNCNQLNCDVNKLIDEFLKVFFNQNTSSLTFLLTFNYHNGNTI